MDVRLGELERIHEADEVVRPHLHAVRLHGPIGLPVPAQVVVDDLEVLRELRRRRCEVEVAEPGAVDLHHRLPVARHPVPQVDAVDLGPALDLPVLLRDGRVLHDV